MHTANSRKVIYAALVGNMLIGESAHNEANQEIHKIAASFPGIQHVNEVLTLQMGPGFILANISIDFVDQVSAAEVEQTIAAIDLEIKSKNLLVKRVFIEAEGRRIFTNKSGVVD